MQGKLNDTVAFLNASTNGSGNVDILKMKLELPELRALQCARFLEYCDSRFQSFTYHNVGAGARKAMCDFLNGSADGEVEGGGSPSEPAETAPKRFRQVPR